MSNVITQPPAQMSVPKRAIAAVVSAAEGDFAGYMPAQLRPMAERFLKQAEHYIATCNHREKLQLCTLKSIAGAILEGAKHGILCDGKQGHLVPFNTKVKDADGRERWENQAQFIADYKGIINAVKRTGAAKDVFAEHVYENDEFGYQILNGVTSMSHIPELGERGEYRFTYACIVHHDNRISIARMNKQEIEAIRARSKAANNGPWVTDWFEMAKKTVIKRLLKTQVDDIEVCSLLEADDAEYADAIDTTATTHVPKIAVKKKTLNIAAEPIEPPETNYSEPLNSSPDNQFSPMFAHCKTAEAVEQTHRDITSQEPVENDADYQAAKAAALVRVGGK